MSLNRYLIKSKSVFRVQVTPTASTLLCKLSPTSSNFSGQQKPKELWKLSEVLWRIIFAVFVGGVDHLQVHTTQQRPACHHTELHLPGADQFLLPPAAQLSQQDRLSWLRLPETGESAHRTPRRERPAGVRRGRWSGTEQETLRRKRVLRTCVG